MYPGNSSVWGPGDGYQGGPSSYSKCNALPRNPICGGGEDDLRELCKFSFSKGLRYVSGMPYISTMCEVSCPEELYQATGDLT